MAEEKKDISKKDTVKEENKKTAEQGIVEYPKWMSHKDKPSKIADDAKQEKLARAAGYYFVGEDDGKAAEALAQVQKEKEEKEALELKAAEELKAEEARLKAEREQLEKDKKAFKEEQKKGK